MARRFMQTLLTPSVLAAQQEYFGHQARLPKAPPEHDALGDDERLFIEERDSFYLATITESGWPYLQHRGGAPGFLRVVSSTQLAFADYTGNRQLISAGSVSANPRVALFLMDYPNRARLKLLGKARVEDARLHPDLVARFAEPDVHPIVERLFFIEVLSYDWNCPKYITPRFTQSQVHEATAPLRERIAELESQLRARGQ